MTLAFTQAYVAIGLKITKSWDREVSWCWSISSTNGEDCPYVFSWEHSVSSLHHFLMNGQVSKS